MVAKGARAGDAGPERASVGTEATLLFSGSGELLGWPVLRRVRRVLAAGRDGEPAGPDGEEGWDEPAILMVVVLLMMMTVMMRGCGTV